MINPAGIPQFTGDFDQLERDVSALRSDAIGIRNGGADVHSRFQMLGAYYTAPEAEDLFASTRPVLDGADGFAAKLESVADALDTYAIEARPLAERLERLQAEALTFTASVEGDDDWTEDEAKVQRNQRLIDDVTATQAAFQDAERRAASRITALVGGPAFVADDGSGVHARNTVPYGYEPGLLEGAEELPWGTAEEQTYDPWSLDWFGHGAKSFFYDGVYKDGIEAAARGMWDLVTLDGDAWSGLGDVVTGVGLYTLTPYDAFMDWAIGPDEESADEQRAKTAAKEFGKALVAWDQWGEDPARAAGTVVFNALTLGAGPLGAASKAGKGGLAARSAGAAAKAGLLLDPVYVGLRASSTAFSKLPTVSELTSRVIPVAADAQRVHSVIELRGAKVLIEDGRFIRLDEHDRVMMDRPSEEAHRIDPERKSEQERRPATVGAGVHQTEPIGQAQRQGEPTQMAHGVPNSDGSSRGGAADSPEGGSGRDSGVGHSSEHGAHSAASPVGHGDSGPVVSNADSGVLGRADSEGRSPRPPKEWKAGDDIVGPARGKTLLYPNSRHDLSGVRNGVPDTENTVILPETRGKVRQDIAEIAAGRAEFDPQTQRYMVNGRRYAVEPHGRIFPVDGPGLMQLNRVEYTALKAIMRANGDLSKVETMFAKAPQFRQNPQSVEKAIALYRKYYT